MLTALSPAGVTMRGINLDSFEDWIHQIARSEEPDLDLITMFVPLFRVERATGKPVRHVTATETKIEA